MSKYIPATFQPTVRPDWAGVLSYLSDKEKSEILVALFKYPSVECKSTFWLETIKPDLDLQYEAFQESCKAKSRGIRNRWGKISITNLEDINKTSTRHDIVTEREREEESKKESEDENKGGVGEKEEREFTPEQKAANKEKAQQIIQQTAQVVKRQPDQVSITYNNVIVHGLLGKFLKQNFGEDTVARARDWMIDHVAGQNWSAARIIKLMCKWTGRTAYEELNKWTDFVEENKNQNKNQNNS